MAAYSRLASDENEKDQTVQQTTQLMEPNLMSNDTLEIAETLLDPRKSSMNEATDTFHYPPVAEPPATHATARSLRKSRSARLGDVLVDIVLVILPFLFIALGVAAVLLDGKSSVDNAAGDTAVSFSRLSGTFYPIVFACIVSRFLQKLARWHAERGSSTIGFLETLHRSQSFASCVTTAASLHLFDVTGVVVFLIWMLSPIGGQSSLRVLSTDRGFVTDLHDIYYANYNFTGGDPNDARPADTDGVFRASLLTPSSAIASPRDMWGHVKVPYLDGPNANASTMVDAWIDVRNMTGRYDSLIGIPMWNIPAIGASEFQMPWRSVRLACTRSNITYWDYCNALNDTGYEPTEVKYTGDNGAPCNINHNDEYNFFSSDWDGNRLGEGSTSKSYMKLNYTIAPNNLPDRAAGLRFSCDIRTLRHDIWVTCQNANCSVTKLRRSTTDHQPDWANIFNENRPDAADMVTQWNNTLVNLNSSISQPTLNRAFASQKKGGGDGNYYFLQGNTSRNWFAVTNDDFSYSMTQAWNSYMMALYYSFEAPVDISTPINTIPNNRYTYNESNSNFMLDPRPLKLYKEVYTAAPVWVALLLAISLFLELCAILSIVFSQRTLAPDILGYVSSMTRDSPEFPYVGRNSALSGEERARMLRAMKVQIADVRPDDTVGRVSLTCVDGRTQQELLRGRLTGDRLYV